MGLFEIDDPAIDVEALEKRVRAAIEAKRGVRFSDAELEELRGAELKPRLRREELPRGWLAEMPAVRSKLAEVAAPPSAGLRYRAATVDDLFATGHAGLKGRLLALFRRMMRPLVRASLNLEWVLARLNSDISDGIGQLAGDINASVNQQGAWAEKQLSDMSGQLERWRERDLHLYHNLVTEITALRLQQTHMQDRINELIRQLDTLKERERALEALTVPPEGRDGPARRAE
jgi:hypothetical protein